MTRSGKLLNNTLVENLRTFRSSVNLVFEKLSTDPAMRSCLARDGLTSTRETKTNRSTAVDWPCKTTTVKQIGHFSQPRSLLICATIEGLPIDVGQPIAWTELVVLMLIDVRRAHFCSAAR